MRPAPSHDVPVPRASTRDDLPRSVLDSLIEGCQVVDAGFRYLYLNDAAVRHARRPREELLGRTMIEAYPGIDSTPMFDVLRRCLEERVHERMENRFEYPDGTCAWFELRFEPVPQGAAILSFDISARKLEEERAAVAREAEERRRAHVEHLNAVLRGVRGVNQLITHERDLQRLLDGTCGHLVGSLGVIACAVLLRENGRTTHRAGAGEPERLRTLWELLDRGEMPACLVRAADAGDVVHSPDPATGCPTCPMSRVSAGTRDTVAVPLECGGRRYGAILVCLPPEAGADVEEDLDLVREVAGDLGFALHAVETEAGAKRAREQLLVARDRLQAVVQASPAAIISFDGAGRVLTWNAAAERIFGWSAAEVEGRPIPNVPREELTDVRDRLRRLMAGDVLAPHDAPRKRKDGSRIWVNVAAAPIRGADGAPMGGVLVAADVDERLRLEERLRRSEARYRTLVENLDDVVLATDLEGRLTYISGAVRQYGYEPADAVGQRFSQFVLTEDLPALESVFAGALQGKREPHEFRVVDSSGGIRHVRVALRALVEDGRTTGATGVVVDRSAHHAMEAQLFQAQKMEAVGRLAGGVAHDFNNLLAVIINYAACAAEGLGADDPLRTDLDEIRRAGDRAAGLTRQLLAFSRRQVLDPEVLDVSEVVAGMSDMLQRLLGEDIELVTPLSQDLACARVDKGQLDQVIMNLAVNSRDAMPEGGRLTVETEGVRLGAGAVPGLPAGSYVRLSVSDTGCGMDEKTRARLFEPFFTTKPPGKGTGLGLATVYGIVHQSGGGIAVTSEPDRGTRVDVYLPCEREAAPAAPSQPMPPVAPSRGETVLVAEDEAGVRNLVSRVLTAAGYEVIAASNGAEALRMFEQRREAVRLVLTDVVMPHMGGGELAKRVAATAPGLPVVFMSGHGAALAGESGLPPGTRLVAKPFTAEGLVRAVRAALDASFKDEE